MDFKEGRFISALRAINWAHKSFTNLAIALSLVAMLLMQSLVTLNAVFRYQFNNPIDQSVRITTLYLMVGAIFLAMADLEKDDGNVRVTILYGDFDEMAKTAVDLFYKLLALAVFVVVLRESILTAIELTERNATTSSGLPTFVSWWIVSLGLTGLCVQFLAGIVSDLKSFFKARESP